MRSESHKGKNVKENWLVSIYYNNPRFFSFVVVGSEIGTGFLFILGKVPVLWEYKIFVAFVAFLNVVLTFKMFVNLH